jgi:cell division GTPase FtsZ
MRVCAIGVGRAGGLIADELLAHGPRGGGAIEHAIAVNTARSDLVDLNLVPDRNRILVGQSRVKGHGVGADCELGAAILEEDIDAVQDGIDEVPVRDIDAFLVIAGLGGGTGAGGAPVLALHLSRLYTDPVYGVGILPGAEEGGIYTLNAARTLDTFAEQTDALVLFDNDVWADPSLEGYEQANRALVGRLQGLLSAPPSAEPAETLSQGGDLVTIGYAADEVDTGSDGLLSRFTDSEPEVSPTEATNRVTSVARKAALGRLTLPAEVSAASHASMSFEGPDAYLSRKGIERSRTWLAEEADATVAADGAERSGADHLSCTVVLSGIGTAPRIEELREVAAEAADQLEATEAEAAENVDRLVEDDDEDLDPLFGDSDDGASAAGSDGTTTDGHEAAAGGDGTTPGGAGATADETAAAPDAGQGPGDEEDSVSAPTGSAGAPAAHTPATIPDAPRLDLSYDDLEQVEPIGRGGNADVHLARAPGPDGPVEVAVKEPRMGGTLHRETVDRLLSEAETWSKLDDHDHIVGVVDYGAEPLPWIAMEYMDGGSLAAHRAGMSFDQRLWTAIAVARAVRAAHRRGVAHLDLKPENVLFRTVEDGWDVPKVADWGLSKHLLDASGSLDGLSPTYAAPEQFDDSYGPTDNVTDVYQLGALCYELFTGRPPFEGSPMEVMNRITSESVTPPSEIADVPAAFDPVFQRALATDRSDRYEDVLQFRNALQERRESR